MRFASVFLFVCADIYFTVFLMLQHWRRLLEMNTMGVDMWTDGLTDVRPLRRPCSANNEYNGIFGAGECVTTVEVRDPAGFTETSESIICIGTSLIAGKWYPSS